MNDNLKKSVSDSKMSMYELAAKSAVPYTTINRLIHDKMDINRLSADALYKISIILKTDMQDLLNPIMILDNATNHHGKIKYKWISREGNNTCLSFRYKNKDVLLDMEEQYNNVKYRDYYDYFAQMSIENYIEDLEFDEDVQRYIGETLCKDIF